MVVTLNEVLTSEAAAHLARMLSAPAASDARDLLIAALREHPLFTLAAQPSRFSEVRLLELSTPAWNWRGTSPGRLPRARYAPISSRPYF